MKKSFSGILFMMLSVSFASAQSEEKHAIEQGKFQPNWESFIANYQTPEWFKDAKFGIWAHWSAQCVPEQGDWYARHMYMQGWGQYNYHVEHYGHPSKFGFMELDNLWKADKWDPERLMQLYVKAGAKYFVTLANHHDNFDAYNSKHHAWNSVNVGAKKDIVGTWEKLARANGLYFGVSNHSAHAWHWLQTAYGYDPEGPLAGVRYDAATLTKEDGKGKWWEGLDPQELYTGPTIKMPDGITTKKDMVAWHEANTRPWDENPPVKNPAFTEKWFLRCQDLVDQYKPDLLYFDDFGLPLGQAGLDMVAHYYNASMKWNNGKLQAVVNAKELAEVQRKGIVEDIERGFSSDIRPQPWQTCTCIGEWHYSRDCYEKDRYKKASSVILSLIDIVSKNGNLLLSIPMRGDGTIDEKEEAFLEEMGKWMTVNGGAIYGTRPWKIFGDGPTKIRGGMFNEGALNFTEEDVRYTFKGDALYAFALTWPANGKFVIPSLARTSKIKNEIKSIELLGSKEKITWTQNEEGLSIKLPSQKPGDVAYAFKIVAKSKPLEPVLMMRYIRQLDDKSIVLPATRSTITGSTLRVEGNGNLGYWTNGTDHAYWDVDVAKGGKYKVLVKHASTHNEPVRMAVVAGQGKVTFNTSNTGGWQSYKEEALSEPLTLQKGKQVIKIISDNGSAPHTNVLEVKLVPWQ